MACGTVMRGAQDGSFLLPAGYTTHRWAFKNDIVVRDGGSFEWLMCGRKEGMRSFGAAGGLRPTFFLAVGVSLAFLLPCQE